jgi:hypothetical protein
MYIYNWRFYKTMYILHLIRVWHMKFSERPCWSLCHSTYMARPASSWIDDYFDWTTLESCCSKPPVFPGNLLIQHTFTEQQCYRFSCSVYPVYETSSSTYVRTRIISSPRRQDWLWGPSSLISNRYWR